MLIEEIYRLLCNNHDLRSFKELRRLKRNLIQLNLSCLIRFLTRIPRFFVNSSEFQDFIVREKGQDVGCNPNAEIFKKADLN